MYLYLDSTYDLYLGILDKDFNWLSFDVHGGQKASAALQPKVYELLAKQNIKPAKLDGIFTVNGPGFYTGLRLAEGFSDVFSYFGVRQYSFYSYEVPGWCGVGEGTWFTKAYRGEYFFFNWKGKSTSTQLIKASDLRSEMFGPEVFIHSTPSLDVQSEKFLPAPIHTIDLIKTRPKEIFTNALLAPRKEPFYFRAPEDEFKVNP